MQQKKTFPLLFFYLLIYTNTAEAFNDTPEPISTQTDPKFSDNLFLEPFLHYLQGHQDQKEYLIDRCAEFYKTATHLKQTSKETIWVKHSSPLRKKLILSVTPYKFYKPMAHTEALSQ